MGLVKFALREDSSTICMLEDAGKTISNYCQIITFARNFIAPDKLEAYLCFAPYERNKKYNKKFHGTESQVQRFIKDSNIIPKMNYVVTIESEVEFSVTKETLNHIRAQYAPTWEQDAYMNFFSGKTSGILLFLRVYKVKKSIDDTLLDKGSKGSSQIFHLYNSQNQIATVDIGQPQPLLTDNKFSYLKDEIIHQLKADNAFIAEYTNDKVGISELTDRLTVEKQLRGTKAIWRSSHQNWKRNSLLDQNKEYFDMAKLDYDAIFDSAERVCHQMKPLIEQIRVIQPAQYGEYEYCLKKVSSKSSDKYNAALRIFDMSLRSALKNALYAYQDDQMDFEDAFQESCVGIWKAIWKYNSGVQGLFPSYASMWMKQIMHKNLPYYQSNCQIPSKYQEKARKAISELQEHMTRVNLNQFTPQELRECLSKYTSCSKEDISLFSYLLIPALSIEDIVSQEKRTSEISDQMELIGKIEEQVDLVEVDKAVDRLKERDRMIIKMRYGFEDGREHTLEECGQKLNLTRERVRQLESRALKRLRQSLYFMAPD